MQHCSESEFLELRQRIKESIRKKTQNGDDNNDTISEQSKRKLPYNDFGSFFGPSQTVIAPRVLRDSKSLIENKLLTENKKSSAGSTIKNPKEELKRKVERLKDSRDYSFLDFDDAKLPVSVKEPPTRNPNIPNSKPSSKESNSKPDSSGGQLKPKPGSTSNGQAKKPKAFSSINSRISSKISTQRADSAPRSLTRPLPSSKPMTCVPRNLGVKQRKLPQEVKLSPSKQQRVISKPPLKQQPHQVEKKIKKKPKRMSRDDELALEMVRKLCNTDRYKVRGFDDRDDVNMETSFQDLAKEERRSEKLAKKEDAEQLRLIEEENRQERARNQKKKQKLSH